MKLWRKNKKVNTNNEQESIDENIPATDPELEEINSSESDMWKDAQEAAEFIESNKKHTDSPKESVKPERDSVSSSLHTALKSELDAKDIQLKRMVADFENFRRRQTTEKEEFLKMACKDLIQDLLPVLDNFERAISSSKDAKDVASVISGIELIQKQLFDSMRKNGLDSIQALDNVFDPNFHEAVQKVVDDSKPDETVINELQKGYTLNGKVLRPSMVVVSTVSG
ncbi:nucleotide exchange factor GrpE [bacterium]|nr:MAG: nucleotide exchange factor GrpE [bacterium]